MRPFVTNGQVWGVIRVPAGDPRLIDRTGTERLATTDPVTRTVSVLEDVQPPLLDRVLLHEVAHAITLSWGLLPSVRSKALIGDLTGVEEWAAQLVENHAIEAVNAASETLGRPVCVRGTCLG
jgi:hypothetical protein